MRRIMQLLRTSVPSIILLGAFLVASIGVELSTAEWDSTSNQVAVIVAPFGNRSALETIGAAGGRIVQPGRWRWIAIGADDARAFESRLREEGAWLVLPAAIGRLCSKALS
jgi:hypothetical protein